jgi:hypothetical protein
LKPSFFLPSPILALRVVMRWGLVALLRRGKLGMWRLGKPIKGSSSETILFGVSVHVTSDSWTDSLLLLFGSASIKDSKMHNLLRSAKKCRQLPEANKNENIMM